MSVKGFRTAYAGFISVHGMSDNATRGGGIPGATTAFLPAFEIIRPPPPVKENESEEEVEVDDEKLDEVNKAFTDIVEVAAATEWM